MIISNRLKSIADMVDKCDSIADIGTDHAYLPIYLLLDNICNKAIASDINKGPIQKAEKNIKFYGLENKIQCRIGSGFNTLKAGEAEGAIIAGMGGNLIIDIISEREDIYDSLSFCLLTPAQHSDVLRKFLYENGYKILEEDLCYDEGKYYETIKLSGRCKPRYLEELQYEISPIFLEKKHPLLRNFIDYKIDLNNKILSAIKVDSEASMERKNFIENKNKALKEVIRCL
ncbi:SAM-dependent methyltransferase [Clostridium sp. 19966]|uniref:tRNA (adenine(22)-N(1))-methyltransferase n=1 Tax=Clostridium sp. 19966 TaxID=2768166 RepID=UPI0028DD764B|nr:class I SAM-dependent methyltransferase [Clostridium sp. 19966]MDT8715332.1 SAM-dependent methyltransferase [Clostridium sp. 19966]